MIRMKEYETRRDRIFQIITVIIVILTTYLYCLKSFDYSDIGWHAIKAVNQGVIPSLRPGDFDVEFIWHSLTALTLRIIPGIPIEHAAAITTSMFNALSIIIVQYYISIDKIDNMGIFAGLAFFFLGPVYIPWYNADITSGQGISNTWHNPTNLAVKPFAILCFILIVKILDCISKEEKIDNKIYIWTSILLSISCIVKPSWIQIAIPGTGIYIIISAVKKGFDRKTIVDSFKILAMFVPSTCIIAMQFFILFLGKEPTTGGGIVIAPFDVWRHSAPNVWISFILGFAFPIVVLFCNIYMLKETEVKYGLCLLLAGYTEYILLAENNEKRYHGNFGWGRALSMLLVYLVTVRILLVSTRENRLGSVKEKFIFYLQWVFFFISLWFGMLYYYRLWVPFS